MKKNKFSDYKTCINYLFDLERAGIKYDLKNIRSLLKFSDNPQNDFKSIHIAGTNGKGSVSSVINSVLVEAGYKTGLYTSPHIKDFRERVLVNGKFISKNFILDFTDRIYKEIERIKPSFFEVTTAMAFEYFRFMKVDYAVIETGLGGRLDSTNILKPVLTIITSLSIDHTGFLGNSIRSITREKGGIIKKNIPLITGNIPELSKGILSKIARSNNSKIIFSGNKNKIRIIKRTESGFYFDMNNKFKKLFFPVIGDYQISNIITSLSAIDEISKLENITFGIDTFRNAFKNLRVNSNLYGRFDLISKNPKVVIDISHNLQSIKNIRGNLKYFKYEKLIIIFAMMSDKNYKECLVELSKLSLRVILTKPRYYRSADPQTLYKAAKEKSGFIAIDNLKDAYMHAKEEAGSGDLILVTGSFFLVSDFLKII